MGKRVKRSFHNAVLTLENKSESSVTRDCQHMSNKSRKKISASYKLQYSNYFFPSPHITLQYLSHPDNDNDDEDYVTLDDLFRDEKPQYYSDHHRKKVPKLKKGCNIKLKSLLSNNKQKRDFLVTKNNTKVDVSFLKGKYVLICCFFVPVLKDSHHEVEVCVSMGNLCSELCARGDFEMVMVAKMRRDWDSEIVFDHFFSGFHDKCLTIPYSDSESRDFVANYLDLGVLSVAALVVDPSGEVLQEGHPYFLREYGVDSFPFTDVHIADLCKQDEILKCRLDAIYHERWKDWSSLTQDPWSPISLQELIQCDTLSKLSDEGVCVSVSDLSKKLVGLYLCEHGRRIDFFARLQRQCMEKGLEFEIVLMCVPFYNDPESYMRHVKLAAKELGISSWWVLPYNDKLYRTLCRICMSCGDEQMIMLPPPDGALKSGDFEGKAIANVFGINEYPFTKEAIVAKREFILKSYTIESLFQDFEYVVEYKGGLETRVALSNRRDKNVIVFFEYFQDEYLNRLLRKNYSKIQAHHPDTQFILLQHNSYDDSVSLTKAIMKMKDGRILSRNADKYLDDEYLNDVSCLFNDKYLANNCPDVLSIL